MTDSSTARSFLDQVIDSSVREFATHRRILSFGEFLDAVAANPTRFARNSAQYLLDAVRYWGTTTVERHGTRQTRHRLFDAPFDDGDDRVIANETTQRDLVRLLENFAREGRVNRLLLIHGPNGSAKSSLVSCLMRALESYAATDEGALYRFAWVFPGRRNDGGRIGFGGVPGQPIDRETSWAHLEDSQIDARIASEHNDNPLFLLPRADRARFLEQALAEFPSFVLSDTIRKGDLGHRSRQVFDALLAMHRGDLGQVWRHVQVERFFVSRRYRSAAVTVEPQLRVDAGIRQITADRSLAALPSVLQSETLFETFGPLVEGNRGVVEYNDLLKRPMEANRYLLATCEKGTVSLDNSIIHLDAVLIATANETYLEAFKGQPDWASYKGRIELIRMPYLLDWRAEQQIYDEHLAARKLSSPPAPHATFAAALWSVMTRLRRPRADGAHRSIQGILAGLSPIQKALLYADGTPPPGLSAEQRQQLALAIPALLEEGREGPHYEGRYGASPREMKSLLLNAAQSTRGALTPLAVFAELRQLIRDTSVFEWLRIEPDGEYHRPDRFIDAVRTLVLDRMEREVREATGLVDDAEYVRVFERYVLHAKHDLQKEKLTDPLTGRLAQPDPAFMREVESTLGRTEPEEAFRSHLISQVAAFRIDHPEASVDLPRIFPTYFEKMREHHYRSRKKAVERILRGVLALEGEGPDVGPDAGDQEAATRTLSTLASRFGYSPAAAREAISMLLRERFDDAPRGR